VTTDFSIRQPMTRASTSFSSGSTVGPRC